MTMSRAGRERRPPEPEQMPFGCELARSRRLAGPDLLDDRVVAAMNATVWDDAADPIPPLCDSARERASCIR